MLLREPREGSCFRAGGEGGGRKKGGSEEEGRKKGRGREEGREGRRKEGGM